ncbi:uncharacterized protein [Penaeus vannamei]|uniref:uncharacterized protein n=1 Tax=Penaeus vannamei TaxID=6689 RepID=UPI00387F6C73
MPPPPTYTKGKWLPGKKLTNIIKVGSSIEYHCHACNRTLKGKETYERHLNSELHFVNENKASALKGTKILADVTPSSAPSRPVRSKKLEAQSFLKSTIARLKSRKILSPHSRSTPTSHKASRAETQTLSENKAVHVKQEVKVEPQVDEDEEEMKTTACIKPKLLCPICKLSFGEPYAALHFASLAHIHNELEYKQNPSDEVDDSYRKIILNNFSAIVKTSPFHCIPCSFYCNLHEDFVIHMKTHKNDPEDDEFKTLYTCSVCNDEDSLLLPNAIRHLQTPHHLSNARDVVLQAHQVIMSSRSAVVCPLGDGTFRYFREYRRHRRLQHQDPGFQLSDQRLLRCPQCNFRALRERQIRAHIKEAHELTRKSDAYHCFVCGLAFVTHRQAELHRRSAEHRTTLGRQRGLSVLRTCTLCYVEVEDLPALRRHMCQEHRKDCTPCHLCGLVPPLRSDLAQHQRNCSGSPGDWAGMHKCELCSFKNDLLAHVLTHTTLAHGQRGADNRYSCHICKTKLRFSSVKGHMLSHSNEWPHACHLCSRKFPRQKWLDRHLSVVHTRGEAQLSDGPALCDTCGKTFSNRWHLQRHQQEAHSHAALTPPSQSEKAPSDAAGEGAVTPSASRAKRAAPPVPTPTLCDVCGVQCDSASMLKAHRQGHKRREGDVYQCPHCNYSTGHLPHLRRHLRLHTGSTPFSCPYCAYSCNNQENLRKHMLKTKRHPGRFMYECRLCASLFGAEAAALKPMSHEAEDAEGPRRPMDYGDAHVLGPLEDSRAFASPGPLAPLEGKLFKTNYATEFHAHLLERHRNHFDTKEEVTTHIRSYYRPEHDATVTTTPLPFIHKKRQRHSARPPKRLKKERPDDPANEDTDEGDEDVLSQIRKSLDIGDYVAEEKGVGGGGDDHDSARSHVSEEAEAAGMHSNLQEGAVVHKQFFHVEAGGSASEEAPPVVGGRSGGPKSYLRAGTRPSILRPPHAQPSSAHIPGTSTVHAHGNASGHNQGNAAHPLRILIQQLSEGAPGEAEDDGARQVILILPDKFSEQTGDVAALLPSLGLAPSPSDCVSIVTVQPKDAAEGGHAPPSQLGVLSSDHSLPGTSHAKDGPEGCPNDAVLMPADQVVTLETQMVPDATIIEGGVAPEGAAQVVLCPPAADPEQVLNPLHMVAEAAEALTQSDMLAAQVMEPHTAPPPVRHQAQMLPAALFEPGGSIQQPGAGQLPGAARMLQQEPTLEFVDNRVVAAEGGAKGGASDTQAEEIIYSFTLP